MATSLSPGGGLMQSVAVCLGCGRTVNKEYLYCPWCGLEKTTDYGLETLNSVFDKLEVIQHRDRIKHFDKLTSRKLFVIKKYNFGLYN